MLVWVIVLVAVLVEVSVMLGVMVSVGDAVKLGLCVGEAEKVGVAVAGAGQSSAATATVIAGPPKGGKKPGRGPYGVVYARVVPPATPATSTPVLLKPIQ